MNHYDVVFTIGCSKPLELLTIGIHHGYSGNPALTLPEYNNNLEAMGATSNPIRACPHQTMASGRHIYLGGYRHRRICELLQVTCLEKVLVRSAAIRPRPWKEVNGFLIRHHAIHSTPNEVPANTHPCSPEAPAENALL